MARTRAEGPTSLVLKGALAATPLRTTEHTAERRSLQLKGDDPERHRASVGRDGLSHTQSGSAPNLSAVEAAILQGGSGQTSGNQDGGRGAGSPPPASEAVGGPSTWQLEAPGLKQVKSPESLLSLRPFGHYQIIF